jgi:HAE1 family hydrophobic/amphiphilic exporter-1
VLDFTLDHKWIGPAVGLTVIASAIYPSMKVDKNMETSQAEMFIGIRYNISESMSLEKREALATQVEQILAPHRDEMNIRSIYSFFSGEWTMTRLYMKEGHTNEAEMNDVRKRLATMLPKLPGVGLEVQDNVPFWERNRGKRVGFQLTGEDTEVLSRLADEAKVLLEQVEGLHSVYSTTERGNYEVQTRVDRDLAREYDVGVDQAANVVELTFRGQNLPRFIDDDEEVQMRLALDERETESLEQLRNLPMIQRSGTGSTIPLATVADFRVAKGPDEIQRDNRATGVWVGGRFDEGTQDEYVQKCMEKLDTMVLPYGYRWEHRRFRHDVHESQMEFVTNLLLALGLIFAVMAGLFESVRQAGSLLVALPFALAGAAWTLYLTGTDFDQPAAVGLLLLFGIVVNNGIVMIEHINGYRRKGMPRRQAMLTGGRERLRPVLMTAVTTLLGLLPIVIQKPSLAGVYYYSMALVIMGGLAISTVLTTILLPTTVCITEDVLGWMGRCSGSLSGRILGRFRRPARPVVAE